MSFRITALDRSQFEHLFHLSAEELAAAGARRVIANEKPGFPCRVSLADAEIGEELILVNYEHLPVNTPYRASHAVYIRKDATKATLEQDEVPEVLQTRVLSLRGFSEPGMLITADLADGRELGPAIDSMFLDREIAFIHIHNAKPGCYAARADRA